ncbi:MAG: DUF4838 domain-containing protein [Ferruginibacter sp.]
MAFIRNCIITPVIMTVILCFNAGAQTIYYPVLSSSLLKATAADAASLLNSAVAGSNFSVQEYSSLPVSGILFIYDPAITDNQLCKVESNGNSFLKFTAAEDNGLVFGLYRYLEEAGFRFYQPGSIWQMTPSLISPYKVINKSYTTAYKYKSWFISGGHNRWAMDNNNDYGWDIYYGQNGHNWALYQRRNGMQGAYRFSGHRGDIMTGDYFTAIQNNPCYVACYDGSRAATTQSVPDVNSSAAMLLWSSTIEQKFTSFKNIIYGNKPLYADHYRNFNFNNELIGIEVPDGSQWGNSKDNSGCSNKDYEKESDQNFTLANFTAHSINNTYPGKHLQLYAYSSHADVPSPDIPVNSNIDIQVVPAAFQNETSAKGLLNRWYNRSDNISEYQYMNIPQWGGETPMFYLNDLKNTLLRLKEKKSQGVLWEASPAKFSSLPFLWAANKNLVSLKDVDSSLNEFCSNMFGPAASSINELLHQWSDDNTITVGDFIQDNKYKIPLYFQLLDVAVAQTSQSPELIKQRLRELKAYLHYMVLYYDWLFDQRSNNAKTEKAATLCIYLAKINKLQLVNSYFIITDIVSRFATNDPFYIAYNVNNGTAYHDGSLPLITNEEIDSDYAHDYNSSTSLISTYRLLDAGLVTSKINSSNIIPAGKVTVKIGYTNGAQYPNRAEFYISAQAAGSFTINYVPRFDMAGKGHINFTVEAVDKGLEIIKDLSLNSNATAGKITVSLPHAGVYKLSVVSKYQSSADIVIECNGNYFYKNSAFLGNKTENYRTDLQSLPGFFFVPQGLQKVYFSINNSDPGGNGFASAAEISTAFIFKDSYGNRVEPQLAVANDSALFYIDIPATQTNAFWQVFKMEQYNLCFANINNMLLYASRKVCTTIDFKISVDGKAGNCLTQLSAVSNDDAEIKWEVYDGGRWTYYGNEKEISLPDYVSPNAMVTLFSGPACSTTKRIADAPGYYAAKEACASGAPIPVAPLSLTIFPNPSTSIFYISLNGIRQYAEELMVMNILGKMVLTSKNSNQADLSLQPAGVYLYRILIDNKLYNGKLIKL